MPRAVAGGSVAAAANVTHHHRDYEHALSGVDQINLNKEKVYSKASFAVCETLPAVKKLNRGRFDDITLKDVETLFEVLDGNKNKVLEFQEIGAFMREVLEPPCSNEEVDFLWEFIKEDDKTTISAEDLYTGLVAGPMKTLLLTKQKEYKIRLRAAKAGGVNAQVDRDLLTEQIDARVSRDDSFATLPLSMLMIAVFITLVTTHLHIENRRQVASGIEDWLNQYGAQLTGPFFPSYVADVQTMWDWLAQSGALAIWGDCRNQTDGQDLCRLAHRNILLNDAKIIHTRPNHPPESRWLLHSEAGQAHLVANPSDYAGAARAEVAHLKDIRWADKDTDEMNVRFASWNPTLQLFAINEVRAIFDASGQVTPVVSSSPIVVAPYADKWLYGLDCVYLIILLYPLYTEVKDMVKACQVNGCIGGLREYWGLWNAVDWLNITMGLASTLIWVLSLFAMGAPSVQALLEPNAEEGLIPGVMTLDVADLENIDRELTVINTTFFYLHVTMSINAISIVAKFFKAFQANPRLRLVTDTLVRAAEDIAHFSIVFMAVFLAYAVLGHISFGSDLIQFSSMSRSINTAFMVLMGEFGWYTSVTNALVGLNSGLPRAIVVIWFWTYMIFVLLIMLNMLLAIVLEHYTVLQEQIRCHHDAQPVWRQAQQYVKRAKATKGFVPMFELLCKLEDKHAPAHPDVKVTRESMMRAFPEMKKEQADWLMDWLSKEAALRILEAEEDEHTVLLKELEALLEGLAEEQRLIGLGVASCSERLSRLRGPDHAQGEAKGGDVQAKKDILELALAPPTRGQLVIQLAAQAATLKELASTATALTSRLDAMAPNTQPLPVVLRELTQDVAAIKSRVDRLTVSTTLRTSRSGEMRSPPRATSSREVPLCFALNE